MKQCMRDGNGVDTPYGPHLWLDLRHLGEQHLITKLREVFEICRDFAGLNPVTDLIPVQPTQHYSMGGVRVNKDGQAYGMNGLFAAGEASCWDMHGFNRLGGNSLAETVVAGRLVGRAVADYAAATSLDVHTSLALGTKHAAEQRAGDWLNRSGSGPDVYSIRDAMGETMMSKVGIFRTGDELTEAVDELHRATHRLRPGRAALEGAGHEPRAVVRATPKKHAAPRVCNGKGRAAQNREPWRTLSIRLSTAQ